MTWGNCTGQMAITATLVGSSWSLSGTWNCANAGAGASGSLSGAENGSSVGLNFIIAGFDPVVMGGSVNADGSLMNGLLNGSGYSNAPFEAQR